MTMSIFMIWASTIKLLQQRNKLLKQIAYKSSLIDTLDIWDEQLVLYGTKIIKSRTKFLEMLSEIVTENNIKLTGGREHVKVFYEPDILVDDFSRKLKENREKDMLFVIRVSGRTEMTFVLSMMI